MGTLAAALRWPLVCTDIYHRPDGGWEGSALIFRKGKQGREVSKIMIMRIQGRHILEKINVGLITTVASFQADRMAQKLTARSWKMLHQAGTGSARHWGLAAPLAPAASLLQGSLTLLQLTPLRALQIANALLS